MQHTWLDSYMILTAFFNILDKIKQNLDKTHDLCFFFNFLIVDDLLQNRFLKRYLELQKNHSGYDLCSTHIWILWFSPTVGNQRKSMSVSGLAMPNQCQVCVKVCMCIPSGVYSPFVYSFPMIRSRSSEIYQDQDKVQRRYQNKGTNL